MNYIILPNAVNLFSEYYSRLLIIILLSEFVTSCPDRIAAMAFFGWPLSLRTLRVFCAFPLFSLEAGNLCRCTCDIKLACLKRERVGDYTLYQDSIPSFSKYFSIINYTFLMKIFPQPSSLHLN